MQMINRRSFGSLLSTVLPASLVAASASNAFADNKQSTATLTLYRWGTCPDPIRLNLYDCIVTERSFSAKSFDPDLQAALLLYTPPPLEPSLAAPSEFGVPLASGFQTLCAAVAVLVCEEGRFYYTRAELEFSQERIHLVGLHGSHRKLLEEDGMEVYSVSDIPGRWKTRENFTMHKDTHGSLYIVLSDVASELKFHVGPDWAAELNPGYTLSPRHIRAIADA